MLSIGPIWKEKILQRRESCTENCFLHTPHIFLSYIFFFSIFITSYEFIEEEKINSTLIFTNSWSNEECPKIMPNLIKLNLLVSVKWSYELHYLLDLLGCIWSNIAFSVNLNGNKLWRFSLNLNLSNPLLTKFIITENLEIRKIPHIAKSKPFYLNQLFLIKCRFCCFYIFGIVNLFLNKTALDK